jgi:uncharacterized membrane protein
MLKKRIEIDLLAIVILTFVFILISFTDSISWLRVALGFPILILFPGYLFIGALYPRKDSLSHISRIALSLGLSIVMVVLTGLMLNYFPWGIGLYSIIISISILILLLSVIAWYIRGRYHPDERYGFTIKLPSGNFINYFGSLSRVHLSLVVLAICSITGFAVFLGYTLAKPPERQPFTEFYILGIENRADDYPLALQLGEEGAVIVGIVNHEHEATDYRIEVIAGNNELYKSLPIELKPEETWHGEIKFTPEPVAKRQKIEFRLTKDKGQPDEVRYIWIDVKT